MSLITTRRRHEDVPSGMLGASPLNEEIVRELSAVAAKRFTGSLDVVDKATRAQARLYLYEGGLYAVELDGCRPAVLPRILATGALDDRSEEDLATLAAVDPAHAGPWLVEAGWIPVGVLAGIHQEFLLASLGAVLGLGKVKVRTRKGAANAYACTLPLPVEPLYDVVRMRLDRLDGTVSMLAPGVPAGAVVLRRTQVPPAFHGPASELSALCREVDGVRSLDALAAGVGFTRAEAVHVASLLVTAGVVTVVPEATYDVGRACHLVPESFGSFAATDVLAPVGARPTVGDAGSAEAMDAVDDEAVDEESTGPAAAGEDLRVTPLPVSALPGSPLGLTAVDAARALVSDLLDRLQASIHLEQEAIARTAEVSQQLRDARVALARLEAPALSHAG